jgi:transcriptional regulator with XRE-family HTH domain
MTKNPGISQYIRARLQEKGMSGRAAAKAMGISHPYFVRVVNEKANPGVRFCIRLARAFDDSAVKMMRLAGIIPEPEDVDETLMLEIRELSGRDPRLKELLRTYQDLTSDRARDAFLSMDETLMLEIRELSDRDPRFEKLLRLYQSLTSDRARDALLSMAEAALETLERKV